jgi:hypothetical protein
MPEYLGRSFLKKFHFIPLFLRWPLASQPSSLFFFAQNVPKCSNYWETIFPVSSRPPPPPLPLQQQQQHSVAAEELP